METGLTLSVDDLERLEHTLDIIVEMHDAFSISLEEAAGRFDRYVHRAMRFAESEMFFHATAEELAGGIYYGFDEWRERRGQNPPVPQPYP